MKQAFILHTWYEISDIFLPHLTILVFYLPGKISEPVSLQKLEILQLEAAFSILNICESNQMFYSQLINNTTIYRVHQYHFYVFLNPINRLLNSLYQTVMIFVDFVHSLNLMRIRLTHICLSV